jgi:pantoate--beta-alanine ligase
MKILKSPDTVQELCLSLREEGKTIALVPTMGVLHDGHLSLIETARKNADKVIVSIFVNPTQFGLAEDFDGYPRTFEADKTKCKEAGVDIIFAPLPANMYSEDFSIWIDEEKLSDNLCGARRPGHFKGVCTVVLKLFMICQPNIAVFGKKDAQQALIIRRMVRDLNLPVKIIVNPIVREKDGLAVSSRNQYLTVAEREQATIIYKGLQQVKKWRKENLSVVQIRKKLLKFIQQAPDARIDYISIVDDKNLTEENKPYPEQHLLIAVAVFFGKARLIDNITFKW